MTYASLLFILFNYRRVSVYVYKIYKSRAKKPTLSDVTNTVSNVVCTSIHAVSNIVDIPGLNKEIEQSKIKEKLMEKERTLRC